MLGKIINVKEPPRRFKAYVAAWRQRWWWQRQPTLKQICQHCWRTPWRLGAQGVTASPALLLTLKQARLLLWRQQPQALQRQAQPRALGPWRMAQVRPTPRPPMLL